MFRYLLLFCFFISLPVNAMPVEKLLTACQNYLKAMESRSALSPKRALYYGTCIGYISAVIDQEEFNSYMRAKGQIPNFEEKTFKEKSEILKKNTRYCLPENINDKDLVNVLVKHISDSPKNENLPAYVAVFQAFSEAYPCTKETPVL